MENFEHFRKPEQAGVSTNKKNLRHIAVTKFEIYHKSIVRTSGSNSSVSLPIWNAARLNSTLKTLQSLGLKLSRTDLFLAVMRVYLRNIQYQNPMIDRIRRKNNDLVRYIKISTYCRNTEWESMHAQTSSARICLSHALDTALRLYLRVIEKRLIEPAINHSKTGWQSIPATNSFLLAFRHRTLEILTDLGKYQKRVFKTRKHIHYLRYIFEHRPTTRARSPKNLTFLLDDR